MFALRFGLLFLTWCAFSGLYDPYHLFLGVLASAWVAAVSRHVSLSQPNTHRPLGRLRLSWRVGAYFLWLLGEVVKANIQVLKLSFSSNLQERLSPTVMEFRTKLADDFSRFLLAHSITLTPGTVTVRVDGDRFIVHALTQEMAAGVPGQMEDRILRIFGGKEEIGA